jgi:AraC-like DNA-binding protein
MNLIFEERLSDSPFINTIWRTHSESAGSFTSIAAIHWEMVVMRHKGKTLLTVRGPETTATLADFPADAEWLGITFKLGIYMPHLPPRILRDRRDATLPEATSKSFWLNDSAWQFPDYENAEAFVARLVRDNLLVRDPIIEAALQGQLKEVSSRSVQRHFLQATALTHSTVHQIERARYATALLEQGVSILDTVGQAGYFDQPHLTRSLKHFIGVTPAQITRLSRPE